MNKNSTVTFCHLALGEVQQLLPIVYTNTSEHRPVRKFHHRIPGRRIHRPNLDTLDTEVEPAPLDNNDSSNHH